MHFIEPTTKREQSCNRELPKREGAQCPSGIEKIYDVLAFDHLMEGDWIRTHEFELGDWQMSITVDGHWRDVVFNHSTEELLTGQGFWRGSYFHLNDAQRLKLSMIGD